MYPSRRHLMLIGASAAFVLDGAGAAWVPGGYAQAAEAHYPLHCDPELAAALRAAALAFLAKSDIRVHVLPTSDGLLVPQVAHAAQSDIVMSRPATIVGLAAIGHDSTEAPHPRFRGRVVLACLAATTDAQARGGPIAAPDPRPNACFDSASVLAAIGLGGVHREGTVDTAEAAFMAATGAVPAGLMFLSDARADARLRVVAEAPAGSADIQYVATTTQVPRRPQPEAFVRFLASPEGVAILARYGLEPIA